MRLGFSGVSNLVQVRPASTGSLVRSMGDGSGTSAVSEANGSAVAVGVIRRTIRRVDDRLSRLHGVVPFSSDPLCLLRIAPISCPDHLVLGDATRILPGDLVLDLHLWNEHIPPTPRRGADLAWARLLSRRVEHSLALLAEAIENVPALRCARAIRGKTNFAGWRRSDESLSRLIRRFNFEDVDEGPLSVSERVHDAFENVLIGALTWTHNPGALRYDKLIRQRRPVWMSRRRLLDLHCPPSQH